MNTQTRPAPPTHPDRIGLLAVVHALALIGLLSWRFGGMEPLARTAAAAACLLAPAVTWPAWRQADARLRGRFLRIALPLAALALVVLVSATNPSMRVLTDGGQPVSLVERDGYLRFLPSTLWPRDTLGDFFFNAGLILVGLNVFLADPRRQHQKALLAIVAANTALLACLGSIFKLTGGERIFGIVPSPNPNFFASFVYYNHWGGFALLGAAAAAGLCLHYRREARLNPGRPTPTFLFGVLTFLILLSLPISGARASTAAGALLTFALAFRFVPRSGRDRPRRFRGAVAGTAAIGLLAGLALVFAKKPMEFMTHKTTTQVAEVRTGGIGDARLPVYRETWNLFLQRPVFGWGWHSYRYAFRRVQTFEFKMQNEQKEKSVFLNAHNDWLQLLAETGLVGGVLSLGALIGAAHVASFRWWRVSPSFEVLTGLGCLALLAGVDFPFACPVIVVTAWTLLAVAAGIACDRESQAAASSRSLPAEGPRISSTP